ncbi:FISUMP domain-containing protein [uncultured Fibrobacter sp.]|uniref:FISUMP domain-containing protein n=1 Tax=uncultured Fibrobacter sp. TaxID=261512 RepID=UPI0025F27300|nr:FISUMP domain-containing protein [uncultured Fibrobacter sp.]
MKRQACFLIVPMLAFVVSCTTEPDDDDSWDAAKVCPETGTNSYGMPNRGTFTDERDGQVYMYTTIGNQVWMAQNLNYDAPYSHSILNFKENSRTGG